MHWSLQEKKKTIESTGQGETVQPAFRFSYTLTQTQSGKAEKAETKLMRQFLYPF